MRLPWRRRRDLADRLRPYVAKAEPNEPMVDADSVRMFLYRWMIETGDPIDVVARGFDIDPDLATRVVGGEVRALPKSTYVRLSDQLGHIGSRYSDGGLRK